MYSKQALVAAAGIAGVSALCSAPATQLAANPVLLPDLTHPATAGSPFEVKYDGTGLGSKLSFKLLRGPGNALTEVGWIATAVSNCGTASCTFTWTPDCALQPDTSRYGIQMFDDATCNYQYTTQFGMNAPVAGTCKTTSPSDSAKPPMPSSSAPPMPSSKPPMPSGTTPPYPYESDCEDVTVTSWTSVYKPKATGGYTPTNGTMSKSSPQPPAATYSPAQGGAGRLVAGASGVVAVLAAALLL